MKKKIRENMSEFRFKEETRESPEFWFDDNLSWGAKGMMAFMKTHEGIEDVYAIHSPLFYAMYDSSKEEKRLLDELIRTGYITEVKTEKGGAE